MIAPYGLILPLLQRLDPELANRLVLMALAAGLAGRQSAPDPPCLAVPVFGQRLPNPLGLAAGFDKNGRVPDRLLALGLGFVEVGTVTPLAQPGNPRPRLFRLPEDEALINRLGFNSEGLEAVAARLIRRAGRVDPARLIRRAERAGLVGVNVGCNRNCPDMIADYVVGIKRLGPLAGYVVVNVSSPNTPGLRALQQGGMLERLLAEVTAAVASLSPRPPLLVKLAPDLTDADIDDIAAAAARFELDGLIVSNTTVARPASLASAAKVEAGGLSGRPLFHRSTRLLARMFLATGGRLPLIGVGGIASAEDAWQKILAGASLLQLYTALVWQGPMLIREIKAGLAQRLAAAGLTQISQAVGGQAKVWASLTPDP